eukprot:TRINITY_DN75622_c0_g1_i1.p1 TRINITY_DN75622_c0_g1~~TRINITY_DN75622_c0_g1_i1.p1  ORF type:complete len:455 (+),score=68.62 TRINITY_DN75622_c0_g1_i1:37-1401(+)
MTISVLWPLLFLLVAAAGDTGGSGANDTALAARASELKAEADELARRADTGCGTCGETANEKYLKAAEDGGVDAALVWASRCSLGLGFPHGCDAAKAVSFFQGAVTRSTQPHTSMWAAIKMGESYFRGFGVVRNFTRACEFMQAGMNTLDKFVGERRLEGADADKEVAKLLGSDDTLVSLYFNHGGCLYRGKHQGIANPAERANGRWWALRAVSVSQQNQLPFSTSFGPIGEPTHVGAVSWKRTTSAEYPEPWMFYLWLGHEHGQWLAYRKELGLLGIEHMNVTRGPGGELVLVTEDGSTKFEGIIDEQFGLKGTVSQVDGTFGEATFSPPEPVPTDTVYEAKAKKRGSSFRLKSGSYLSLLKSDKLEQSCTLETGDECNPEHRLALRIFAMFGIDELRALRVDLLTVSRQGCPTTPRLLAWCSWDKKQARHRIVVLEHLLEKLEAKRNAHTEL